MKILLLAIGLLAFELPAPAFAQAPNDIASKLQEGHDYSRGRHAMRRQARAARRHASRVHALDAPATAR